MSSQSPLLDRRTATKAVSLIINNYPWAGPPIVGDPFFDLIGIVLSQHTTDKNAWAGEQTLRRLFQTPRNILAATPSEIASAIRGAGLQNQKTKTIIALAKVEIEQGAISKAAASDWKEARKILLGIPGIGMKTADVFCMLHLGAPLIPIDVHVKRVSIRLGLTKSQKYEGIQSDLHAIVKPEDRKSAHLSMIRFGREVCRAKKPLCATCPLNDICPWYLFNRAKQGRSTQSN